MTQVAEPEAKRWVGGGILRKEDPELLTGQGRYVDDIALPGMLWLSFVRSPVAHATIANLDTAAAKELPGVLAVFTGQELADEWAAAMPCAWPIGNRIMPEEPTADARIPDHWPVAKDRVRFMGEIVAVVVADSREHAADAIEAVEVDYDELPVVTDMLAALKRRRAGAPRLARLQRGLHLGAVQRRRRQGVRRGPGGGQGALLPPAADPQRDRAPRGRRPADPRPGRVHRLVGHPDPAHPQGAAGPHPRHQRGQDPGGRPRRRRRLRLQAERLRRGVRSALAVARRLGLPVKWTEERSEGYLATIHGRDVIQDMEVAATEEGKTLGFRVKLYADFGAYLQLVTPGIPILGAWLYHGVYQGQAYSLRGHRGVHQQDPDRRLPRRRPAGGDLRGRADHGRAGPPGRQGPGRDPRDELHPAVRRGPRGPVRAVVRLRQLPGHHGQGQAAGRLRRGPGASSRPTTAAATASCSGSASRPTSRCAAWPRPRSWPRSSTAPAAGRRPPSAATRPARSR